MEQPEFYPYLTALETLKFVGRVKGVTEKNLNSELQRGLVEKFHYYLISIENQEINKKYRYVSIGVLCSSDRQQYQAR